MILRLVELLSLSSTDRNIFNRKGEGLLFFGSVSDIICVTFSEKYSFVQFEKKLGKYKVMCMSLRLFIFVGGETRNIPFCAV